MNLHIAATARGFRMAAKEAADKPRTAVITAAISVVVAALTGITTIVVVTRMFTSMEASVAMSEKRLDRMEDVVSVMPAINANLEGLRRDIEDLRRKSPYPTGDR